MSAEFTNKSVIIVSNISNYIQTNEDDRLILTLRPELLAAPAVAPVAPAVAPVAPAVAPQTPMPATWQQVAKKLLAQPQQVTVKKLLSLDLSYSIIQKCEITKNGVPINVTPTLNYYHVLVNILKHITLENIVKSNVNVKLNDQKGMKGYAWNADLGLSVQHKCAEETLKDIIYFITTTVGMSMCIEILLADKRVVCCEI